MTDVGVPVGTPTADLLHDDRLREEIQKAVNYANAAVSQAESIKRFDILATDFTEAGGELTPTLKLKRNIVLKEYAGEVEALYR